MNHERDAHPVLPEAQEVKCGVARECLIHHHPECPLVVLRRRSHALAATVVRLHQLRRRVGQRVGQRHLAPGRDGRREVDKRAAVAALRAGGGEPEDVCGADVAVDDARAVQVGEAARGARERLHSTQHGHLGGAGGGGHGGKQCKGMAAVRSLTGASSLSNCN